MTEYDQAITERILSQFRMGQLSKHEALRAMDQLGCIEYYKENNCSCKGCVSARWGVQEIYNVHKNKFRR